MKTKLLSTLAIGLCLSLGACSNEDIFEGRTDGEEAELTFNVDIPASIQSRSYSDGSGVNTVYAFVYRQVTTDDATTYQFVKTIKEAYVEGETTISVRLVKDQVYRIILWAQKGANAVNAAGDAAGTPEAGEAPYTIDPKTGVVSMNYADDSGTTPGNDETRDAFCGIAARELKVTADKSGSVTLSRPFAQLNFATSDYDVVKEAGLEYTKASVTTQSYASLDLINQKVSGDLVTVNFAATAFPTDEIFPNSDTNDKTSYKYLSMNYLLVDQSASDLLDNVKLTVSTDDGATQSFEYTNVPVKKKFRTNVYGKLFSNECQIAVRINSTYEKTYEYPKVASSSAFVAAILNGCSVELANDLETGSITSIPDGTSMEIALGGNTLTLDYSSALTSNCNLTISGGKVVFKGGTYGTKYLTPAFRIGKGATLTLENVEVEAPNAQYFIQPLASSTVTIKNSTITSTKGLCIAEDATSDYDATINVENSTLKGNEAAVLFNVSCHTNLTKSSFYGARNGAILRGGTHNISKCKFYFDLNARRNALISQGYSAAGGDPAPSELINADWGTSNSVPLGALIIGNRSGGYQYATRITSSLADSYALIIPDSSGEWNFDVADYSNVYVYANQGDDIGVYFDVDANIKTSDTECTNPGKGVVFASKNIFVNNVEQALSEVTWK
jgi:hypothetical protein